MKPMYRGGQKLGFMAERGSAIRMHCAPLYDCVAASLRSSSLYLLSLCDCEREERRTESKSIV